MPLDSQQAIVMLLRSGRTSTMAECTGVDWTQVLPEACRLRIVELMDGTGRAAWRVVNKQACQDVYAVTKQLTWREHSTISLSLQRPHGIPLPLRARLDPHPTSFLLPPLASKLPNLRHLRCTDRELLYSIEGIPPTLISLDLSRCYVLQDLSPLHHCTLLTQLKFNGWYRRKGFAETLPSAVSALPSLRNLTIQLTHKRCFNWFYEDILCALAPLTRLTHLCLRLFPNSWQALASPLSQMTDMHTLDLSGCIYGASTALAPTIAQLRQLRSLQLGETCFFNDEAAAFTQALASLPAQLTRLELRGGLIRTFSIVPWAPQTCSARLMADGVMALAPGLRQCSALIELNLNDNEMALTGAAAVAPALGAMTALQRLSCAQNLLGPEGLRLLTAALQSTPLVEWDLSGNALGYDGALVLASYLGGRTSLRRLVVDGGDVGSEGERTLEAAAAQLPGLELEVSDHGFVAAR